MQHSLRK